MGEAAGGHDSENASRSIVRSTRITTLRLIDHCAFDLEAILSDVFDNVRIVHSIGDEKICSRSTRGTWRPALADSAVVLNPAIPGSGAEPDTGRADSRILGSRTQSTKEASVDREGSETAVVTATGC